MADKNFPLVPLSSLANVFDSQRIPVKKADRKPGPFPYYGASGIADYVDSYIFDGEYVLLAEDGENLKTRNTPIAFMATGKFWVNNHAHILQGNEHGNTRFICYALQIADIDSYLSGSTRPKLTQGDMKRIHVYGPSFQEQKEIVHILGTLDDKIELNRRMNETLESMAQALFKSWFVDFDPVIDNALAAGNEIPDALKAKAAIRQALGENRKPLPEKIQKQFPSRFEFTEEMGWIPEGWEANPINSAIIINQKIPLKKGAVSSFVEMKSLPTKGYTITDVKEKEFKGGSKFCNGDVLLARITPCLENGKTGIVDFLSEGEIGFGSTEFIVFRGKNGIKTAYIACLLRDENFRNHCILSMIGTSGRQRVHNACFSDYYLAIPNEETILSDFNDQTSPGFDKIKVNGELTNTLTNLRDTLLPKLLSGELRIPEAAKFVEGLA